MSIRDRISEEKLPKDVAEQILQNVLKKSGKQINTVPLEELTSYSGYRSERYLLLRCAIVILLLLFILIPLLFFYPTLNVKQRNDTAVNRRAYNVTVNCLIPIKTITAEMSGATVPIYEAAGKEYLIVPGDNGDVNVEVTLRNGQKAQTIISVTGIDITGPEITGTNFDSDHMYIGVSDPSGIDPDSITLTGADGTPRSGFSYDAENSRIILEYPKEDLLLSVADIYGNKKEVRLNT